MIKYGFIGMVFLFLISSCKREKLATTASLNGVWESVGSGWILTITDSTSYNLYDVTSISCLPNRSGDLEELIPDLSIKNDTLQLKKGVITYRFIPSKALPEVCDHNQKEGNSDPLYNFEVFAETVRSNYAFFDHHQIDWESVYLQQKATLSETPTDLNLYRVIEETLELINDNHGFLEGSDEIYKQLEEETIDETADPSLPEYGDFQVAQLVSDHHLKEEFTKDSQLIQWGMITDSIGFIQVKAMWLFADLELSKESIDQLGFVDAYVEAFHQLYEGEYIKKEVKGVAGIMDQVMADLDHSSAMVIDIRFNGGGQDAVSFEILSRFLPQQQLEVARQKLRYGPTFTPALPLVITGKSRAYTKPVYVLTSHQTASAAEAFAIATMTMPHVKRIGSPTSGATSTALEKTLPNGWSFAISNEIYTDNQGRGYEYNGVPADYPLAYSKDRQTFFRKVVNDLEGDKKTILNAIDSLQK